METTKVSDSKINDPPDYSKMTNKQKIETIWTLQIMHPKLKVVLEKIERCHKSYARLGEPENLFISGITGLGKTTLCKIYLQRYPHILNDVDDTKRVLYARTPTPATIKNLASGLLEALGDPCSDKGTTVSITKRLKTFLKTCGVQLIILDEFQHLSGTENKIFQAADWLKALIEDSNVPIVVIGLPESIGVLNTNAQLNRRFSHRCELEPFGWKSTEDRKFFTSLLHTIDLKLPFPERSELASEDLKRRFLDASDGVFGDLIKLIRFAAQYSVEGNHQRIQIESIIRAYEEHIKPRKTEKPNPFIPKNFVLEGKFGENSALETGLNGRIRPGKRDQGLEVIKI
jgi:hypothetical protein